MKINKQKTIEWEQFLSKKRRIKINLEIKKIPQMRAAPTDNNFQGLRHHPNQVLDHHSRVQVHPSLVLNLLLLLLNQNQNNRLFPPHPLKIMQKTKKLDQ